MSRPRYVVITHGLKDGHMLTVVEKSKKHEVAGAEDPPRRVEAVHVRVLSRGRRLHE